jgi:enoyl-CoA hydratase/carnithine racemase
MSDLAQPAAITVSISDGVATVEIDNPSQRNALTRSMCLELQELMPALDADTGVEIVTIRGAGDTFSAGASLNELSSVLLDRQDDGTVVDQLSRADRAIAALAKPTIAFVDGSCMGGGWEIASACDFIVASERSVFGITPAKLGVIYPRTGIERLVAMVGPANAKFILFTGETFTARRAQALGLVAEVVPDADFASRSSELLDEIKSRSRFTMHTMKRLVDLTATGYHGLDEEWTRAWSEMADGPDMRIGVSAFLDRQQPRFTWTPEAQEP